MVYSDEFGFSFVVSLDSNWVLASIAYWFYDGCLTSYQCMLQLVVECSSERGGFSLRSIGLKN